MTLSHTTHTIIHIGAGNGSELDAYLAAGAQRIVLVEPIPALAAELANKAQAHHQVTVLEAAVTPDVACTQLHEYNLQEVSSLRTPTGLKNLFPGLRTISTHAVNTITPQQLVQDYASETAQPAILVLQAPGEEGAILQALIDSDQLKCFSQLMLTANPEPFYNGSVAAEHLLEILKGYGYEIRRESRQDPDWPSWELQRNPLKVQLLELEAQLQQLQAQNRTLTDALANHKSHAATDLAAARKLADEKAQALDAVERQLSDKSQERDILQQQLEQQQQTLSQFQHELDEHKGWLAARKKQVKELELSLEQANAARQKLEQENNSLKAQLLQSNSASEQALARLEARMENLFHQQSSQLQQATNALGQHVTRQFQHQRQQIQAMSGLNQYLENGEQPLDFGGWAIGADLAGHLVRAIEMNQYDLIIEFGSGTSTVLLARVVRNTISAASRQFGNQALEHADSRGAAGNRQLQALEDYDLPQRILSFEQDKTFLQQTQNALAHAHLTPLVELVLAPLVPTNRTTQEGNQVLYYDCEQSLARIAQLYAGRTAKILVLVDGPHSPQDNPLIREPALATLLQYLSTHQLHIVLDDANREGEQQVARRWHQLCEQRGLSCHQTTLDTEKGALWISIND